MNHPINASERDKEAEAEIRAKGLTAPRVSLDHLHAVVKSETFTRLPGTRITVCDLELLNGSHVVGINYGSVSAANFDEELAHKYSREDAVAKIWPLEGYLLAQRLHERKTGDESVLDKVDRIARVCHEVNRAYCQALGDNSQPVWDDAPAWQKDSACLGVTLHLTNPDAGPEASHESWMKQKLGEGWVYGPIKDPLAKTHPCIAPFRQLPVEQQAKDFIFRGVVHALS